VKRSVPSAFLWVFLVWLLLLASTGICIAGEYQVNRVIVCFGCIVRTHFQNELEN
jgi:hypothetical protein